MAADYDSVMNLIEAHSAEISFWPPGNGASEEWIQRAEESLGVNLPPTYKWFLREFGFGDIGHEEIYGILEEEFETAVGGDVVYNFLVRRKSGTAAQNQLVLCDNDGDEIFYFKLDSPGEDGEFPVFRIDHMEGSDEPYADDFLEFLKKRIEFLCSSV